MDSSKHRSLASWLFWLFFLSQAAWSQDRFHQLGQRYARFELTFQLYPPDSRLEVGGRAVPAIAGRPGTYILQPSQWSGSEPESPITLRFSLTGYGEQSHSWRLEELRAYAGRTFPTQIRLRPNALPGYWREYPAAFIGLGLALSLLLAEGLRRQHRARNLRRRQGQLSRWQASQSQRFDALVLAQLGRFRIVERLGSGGMASVYRALPEDSLDASEQVAIKCIRPDQLKEAFLERFRREIAVLCKLDHPNIVRVHDWGEQEGLPYLVMEVVEGHTLCRDLPPGGMSSQAFQATFGALVEALSYAHQRGVAHRDLKPSNVMVTRQGRVKLMDFGLAKGSFSEDLTRTGEAMGTPAYVAPETLLGGVLELQWLLLSDQYSLGIMAYEMLCGRRPFEHEEVQVVLMMRLQQPPPALDHFRPELPPGVGQVVARMLERDPKARFATVTQAGQAMQKALQGQHWEARQVAPSPPVEDGATEEIQLSS